MAKKFFDIIPPKEIKPISEKSYLKKEVLEPKEKNKVSQRRFFLKGLISCLVFLILLGTAAFYIFSKVEIEIWPETETLNLKEIIIVDSEIQKADFEAKIIPGKIFNDQKSASEEFSATGKTVKGEKARGVIRVFNAADSPRTLIPSRFVSADGKLFWSTKKIVIPAGRYEKGKLIPGEVDVEAQAAEPGEDYNIEPSSFALPVLAGSPLYTIVYGKSFSAMAGGFKGEVSQVTKEDLENAENILVEKLKKESREFLKTSTSTDFVLLDEAISQEVVETNSSLQALAEAQSFNFQVKVKSEGIGFKKSDIENFAKNLIGLNISEGKKIHEESLEINYSSELTSGKLDKMILNLEIKAKIYSDIDLNELKKALLGKSFKEVKIFLENLPQVTETEIKSWPILRKKIPDNQEKIEIKLRLDV